MLVCVLKWFSINGYKNTGFSHKILLGERKLDFFFPEIHNYRRATLGVGQLSFSPSHDNNSNPGRN